METEANVPRDMRGSMLLEAEKERKRMAGNMIRLIEVQ